MKKAERQALLQRAKELNIDVTGLSDNRLSMLVKLHEQSIALKASYGF